MCSKLVAVFFYLNTQTQEDRNIPLIKHNHCLSLVRSLLRSSNPLMNAVTRSNLVAFYNYLTHTNIRRAPRAPNKHPQNLHQRNAVMRRTPCGIVIDLIMHIQKEHGMPSNKHYEIPFVRSIPCSSLYHIMFT